MTGRKLQIVRNLLEKYVVDCMYSSFTEITHILRFPAASLEQFLRAIWGAVSQAAAFPLPPNKTYLETLMLCIFLSWHPWSSHELRPREFKGMLKFTHRVSSKAKNSWSVSRVWALTTSELKWNMKVLAAQSCQLFVTSWTVVHQAPLSIAVSRQEYWSGQSFPSPWGFPDPGIKSRSLTLQADSLLSEPPGKPLTASIDVYREKALDMDSFEWPKG